MFEMSVDILDYLLFLADKPVTDSMNESRMSRLHDLIPAMSCGQCIETVAPREVQSDLVPFLTIRKVSIIIHTHVAPERAPPIVNPKLVAAVRAAVVVHAGRLVVSLRMIVAQNRLEAKIIEECVSNAMVGRVRSCEVDDASFDAISLHSGHELGLWPPNDSDIVGDGLQIELAQCVCFEEGSSVVY